LGRLFDPDGSRCGLMLNLRSALFAQKVTGSVAGPVMELIRGWGRHSDVLPPSEQTTIDNLADLVVTSFTSANTVPLGRIAVVGHADKDPLGDAFEKKVSKERALTVAGSLSKAIIDLWNKRSLGPFRIGAIAFEPSPQGVGATQPDPSAGRDRTRNRRVSVTLDLRGAPPVKPPVLIKTVKFWLNAFIPGIIPGLTQPVPGGLHQGKTMIPGPPLLDFFLTDNRSFSTDIAAASRMHSEFVVTFGQITGPSLLQFHRCDPTIQIEGLPPTGRVVGTATGSVSRMGFVLRTLPSSGGEVVQVDMKCSSSMPLFALSPDIDFAGTLTIDRNRRTIEIDATVDAFPAFEAYAAINGGSPTLLFIETPRIGATPFNLPGQPSRPERFRGVDKDADGSFKNVEPF
jgi:hypothetical protein